MSIYRSDPLPFKSNDSLSQQNEIDLLKAELENERIFRENALWRNAELEKTILNIQEELQRDDYPWEHDEDLQQELRNIEDLTNHITLLKSQLPELRDKLKNAKVCGKDCRMKHDDLNINLDVMNEIELYKTIKRLERMRTDLKSALISREWSLDNESKLYQRILDQKMHLQNALYHTNNVPNGKKVSTLDRWQNGGITKANRTLDLKRGPINQLVSRGKLPLELSA